MISGDLVWAGQYDGANYRVVSPFPDSGDRDFVTYEDAGDGRWEPADDRTAYRVMCRMLAEKAEDGTLLLDRAEKVDRDFGFVLILSGRATAEVTAGRALPRLDQLRAQLKIIGLSVLGNLTAGIGARETRCDVQVNGDLAIAAGVEKELTGKG